MTAPRTYTVETPGATVTYDVRGELADREPPLMLIGSPMDASGFVSLASYLPDRTIVTYDPRGTARSVRPDTSTESTPDGPRPPTWSAADRPRSAWGRSTCSPAVAAGRQRPGPLVAAHPERVGHSLVAHEPPLTEVLARLQGHAPSRGRPTIHRTPTRSHGLGPGMAKFIAIVSHQGLVQTTTPTWASPIPIPACSACRPRTTAPATTCSSARTCAPAPGYHARRRGP